MLKLIWIIAGIVMVMAGLGTGRAVANRSWVVMLPGLLVSAILILAGILTTFVGVAA